MQRILIVCGEISGDRYAAKLVSAIKHRSKETILYGVGGQALAAVVDHFVADIASSSTFDFFEKLKGQRRYKVLFRQMRQLLNQHSFDKVVLIDFQHLNFKLARLFQSYHIPITTFITPNYWILQQQNKMRKISEYSKKVITIFSKEYELYQKLTDNVYYFGHPLWQDFKKEVIEHKGDTPRLVLFPGSRYQEINRLLPMMLEILQKMRQKRSVDAVIGVSDSAFLPTIQSLVKKSGVLDVDIFSGENDALFQKASAMLSATGTATLQAAFYKVPTICLAKVSWFSYFIAKYVLRYKLPFVALPNILLGRFVIPEYIQQDIDVSKISNHLLAIMSQDQLSYFSDCDQLSALLKSDTDYYKRVAEVVLA